MCERVRESASARARGCERVREGERGCERARMREPETRGLVDLLEHQLVGSQVEVGRVKVCWLSGFCNLVGFQF